MRAVLFQFGFIADLNMRYIYERRYSGFKRIFE